MSHQRNDMKITTRCCWVNAKPYINKQSERIHFGGVEKLVTGSVLRKFGLTRKTPTITAPGETKKLHSFLDN